MGKCDNCGKKIEYNSFVRYRKQILCKPCYKTRLIRKKAKKEALKNKATEIPEPFNPSVDDSTPALIEDPFKEDEE